MVLPPQLYLSVAEIADRWSTTRNHVVEHIIKGGLIPSLFVDEVKCVPHSFTSLDDTVTISGEVWLSAPIDIMAKDYFLASGGLYQEGGSIQQGEREIESLESVLFIEPIKCTISDIRVRRIWVEMYENHANQNTVAPIDSKTQELGTSERKTLLRLVLSMAIQKYGYDPKAERNTATGTNKGSIAHDMESLGFHADKKTIRKYLTAAAEELLPPDR